MPRAEIVSSVEVDIPLLEMVVVVNGRTGIGLAFITLAFFQIWSKLLGLLPSPKAVTREPYDAFREFRWKNLIISWSHACITGTACLLCILVYGHEMSKDMFNFKNWLSYGVACFSTGYFLYDTVDILLAGRIREKWEILLHHVAICIGAIYSLTYLHGWGYHVIAMLIEFNTAFLHARQLSLMAGYPRSSFLVQSLMALNVITFAMFRFVPLYIMTIAIYYHYDKVPFGFCLLFCISMIALNVINGILFYRLVRADFLPLDDRGLKRSNNNNTLDIYAPRSSFEASSRNVVMCDSLQVASDRVNNGVLLTPSRFSHKIQCRERLFHEVDRQMGNIQKSFSSFKL